MIWKHSILLLITASRITCCCVGEIRLKDTLVVSGKRSEYPSSIEPKQVDILVILCQINEYPSNIG